MNPKGDVLPGRGLSLGLTMTILGIVVFVPLASIVLSLHGLTPEHFRTIILAPRTLASLRLTFCASLVAACVDLFLGTFLAWTLARRRFAGRAFLEALVDIPFALPTAVSGLALADLYGTHGLIGHWVATFGIRIAYTPLGICTALTFVGLPFVVRTVQPVLAEMPPELDEASALLGAGPLRRLTHITLPLLAPAMLTGFALAAARGLGEYGSVIFIAGNIPGHTEIAPLLIITRLEEYNYQAASAIAVVLLLTSFTMLLLINLAQRSITHARTAL
jgi:sulfate/thiosulfate transport system permease protein